MYAPKKTYSLMCVSVLFGDTRSVQNICQRKQKHAGAYSESDDQCILVLIYCSKSESLSFIEIEHVGGSVSNTFHMVSYVQISLTVESY